MPQEPFDEGQRAIITTIGFEVGEAIYARHATERKLEQEVWANTLVDEAGKKIDEAIRTHHEDCLKPQLSATHEVQQHVIVCDAPRIARRLKLYLLLFLVGGACMLTGAGLLEGGVIRQLWKVVFAH